MKEYLTQERLEEFLNQLYPDGEWLFNKAVSKTIKSRPDYRSDIYKIIVEFNGFRHYNSSEVIIKDISKYENYKLSGYSVIEIPYFVQLSTTVIKLLFDKDIDYKQTYQHGFIDDKALLPCDFCQLGTQRFEQDLIKFDVICKDILDSLLEKVKQKGNKYLVLPESLFYLIKYE